ncbi:MAG: metallophosphoesterase [Lachnospiraceae bacterium]|nr:metallophosphoesterase [Lachnospiraceae bacterium]
MTGIEIFSTAIIIVLIAYIIYEYFQLRCRKYVRIKTGMGLNLKAIAFTDLHNNALTKRDLKKIREEKPDMILIGGDIITASSPDHQNAKKAFLQLSEIADVYFSLGNHELRYREVYEKEWKELLSALPSSCHVLDDSHLSFNDQLEIYGISLRKEHYKKGRAYDMSKENTDIFIDVPENKKSLLLAHNPDFYGYYNKVLKPDLIISGHLHGGFVRIPGFGGIVYSTYGVKHRDRGFYAGNQLVSSGAGEHLLPLRLFNRCEIDIIEL